MYTRKLMLCSQLEKEAKRLNKQSFFKKDRNESNAVLSNYASEVLKRLRRLSQLQNFEATNRLRSLKIKERIDNLKVTKQDYREIEIKPNSVIYCDIPYRGTDGYTTKECFDHDAFYDWCNVQKELVLISEYNMPNDRFVEVWETKKQAIFSQNYNKTIIERLFVPIKQYDKYQELMLRDRKIRERKGEKELTLFD